MQLLSSLVRRVGMGRCVQGRRVPTGRAMSVLAAIVAVVTTLGVGAREAHAQDCDPTEVAKLLADDGAETHKFGWSVSVSGDTAVVGVPHYYDDLGNRSGSVYVFDLNCNDCPADINGDGSVNTQDFLAFLGAWSAGDPLADWNGDGDINTLDFLAYLADWSAGCP